MSWINPTTSKLFQAILQLRDLDETRRFFRDLLTEPEILEFANRWQVAQMLQKGIPYSQIEQQTGMSSTTIARVSKFLNGEYGGYKRILDRMNRRGEPLARPLKGDSPNRPYIFGTQSNSENQHHHSQTIQVEKG